MRLLRKKKLGRSTRYEANLISFGIFECDLVNQLD